MQRNGFSVDFNLSSRKVFFIVYLRKNSFKFRKNIDLYHLKVQKSRAVYKMNILLLMFHLTKRKIEMFFFDHQTINFIERYKIEYKRK